MVAKENNDASWFDWFPNHVFSMGKGMYCPRIDLRRFSFFFGLHQGSCYVLESKCKVFEVKTVGPVIFTKCFINLVVH